MEWTSEGLRRIFTFELGRAVWIASEKSQRSASLFATSQLTKRLGLRASRLRGLVFRRSARVSGLGNVSRVVQHPDTRTGKRSTFLPGPGLRGVLFGPGTLWGRGESRGCLRLKTWGIWYLEWFDLSCGEWRWGECWRNVGSCLFDFGVVVGYFVSTSAGVIQVFGPKLCARPGFPEKSQTGNSAYLRGALSLVGFIAVYDFIRLCHEIVTQKHKHFRGVWVCNERGVSEN